MEIETLTRDGVQIAALNTKASCVKDAQDALDLIMTVKHESGCDRIAIDKEAFAPAFFVLSSGLAGEMLQKFINYRVKLAIYGDYTGYTSKPLHDFIRESNKSRDIFFLPDRESALCRLAQR